MLHSVVIFLIFRLSQIVSETSQNDTQNDSRWFNFVTQFSIYPYPSLQFEAIDALDGASG